MGGGSFGAANTGGLKGSNGGSYLNRKERTWVASEKVFVDEDEVEDPVGGRGERRKLWPVQQQWRWELQPPVSQAWRRHRFYFPF